MLKHSHIYRKFNRKIIVVKYGGSAMVDEELKRKVIQDVVLLKVVGFKPIIVHGGGKEISKWVGKVGMEAKFINGLRVTDSQTIGNSRNGPCQSKQRTCFPCGISWRTGCWYQWKRRWIAEM